MPFIHSMKYICCLKVRKDERETLIQYTFSLALMKKFPIPIDQSEGEKDQTDPRTLTSMMILNLGLTKVYRLVSRNEVSRDGASMAGGSTTSDVRSLVSSLRSAYAATPVKLKIIDLYVLYALITAFVQVVYMGMVGSFPFNAFLSGVLSCVGTAVLAVCLRMQVNKENKEFRDLPPERAFADFLLCNVVLHLVIMNFLG
ncbi:hypothetical protein R1flu_023855 [Riccia fluitans]|uniref:Dolichyl-diphosphooligosaccharide--protein glycosyltransferase subunit DAD1 n=1 Tax=Riccia fluitans TaxID=41844 RepID=A0ABD1XXA7_9MARC